MNPMKDRPAAIVTGGSRGIGRAVVLALAQQGWDVCFSFISRPDAAQETERLAGQHGGKVLAVKADVSSEPEVRKMFDAAQQAFGRLDALVNNAGKVGGQRPIFDLDAAHLRDVFAANVDGAFFCAAEAARRMSTQKGGRGGAIVNVSSAAARHGGLPLEAHYAASKGAIDSMTVALAKELAPHGIRVNAIRPGLIETDIHEAHGGQATLDRIAPTIPLGRAGLPEEVGAVVAFLCGPGSSYVLGAHVDVSGGR